jgi:16S rRNA (cytosine967-C5)-methyltransferase
VTIKTARTSRFAAIETLSRLQRTRYPVKPLFETVAEEYSLIGSERGLARNLVWGVLRRREYLDLLLNRLCNRPIDKLDTFVYSALSVGLYQLFCLDRIPESAAVNETVNALKVAGLKKHLHGFVNGVLRASIRQKKTLPGPDDLNPSGQPVLNHPEWLTQRWENRFGRQEMERICAVNNREPQLVLRVNSSRISRQQLIADLIDQDIAAKPGSFAPESLVLPDYQSAITSLPGYNLGYFQVQDEAAQLASLLLGPFTHKSSYLDACAGLGGKTSHIMQLTADLEPNIVAVEPEPQRQRLLQANIDRLFPEGRLTICKATLQDYCRTSRLQFAGVLVDAPCSGTGVTGRHPDIRWNRTEEELQRYQCDQLDILHHASELVAPFGILVYATCSLEIEENQEVIEKFLGTHKDFSITDCSGYLPENTASCMDGKFFSPHPTESIDGFFAARLQRNS